MDILDKVQRYQDEQIVEFKDGVDRTLKDTFNNPILKCIRNYTEKMLDEADFIINDYGQLGLRVCLESGSKILEWATFDEDYHDFINALIQDFFANAEYPSFIFE